MTRLRPVPEAPLRALGLIRVSKERDEMMAPALQRTAIEDHCARRGHQLVGWIEGIDESGSQRRSGWWVRLDEAVGQVEAGAADALVVWRFSRTARQRLRWAVAIDRVEQAGGVIESATEPLDTTTASGRLARGMLAEFAAYEAESIGNTWREVHARRTKAGLPANGKPRFGYRVNDGLHRPHEPEASVLADCYRRYVAGESVYALVEWLNAEGIRTVAGYSKRGPGPWTQMALRRCLDAGFGAGWITVRGERCPGAHEPVISAQLWERYLAARESRRTHRRAERSQYLLTGLVRCRHLLPDGSACGSPMGGGQFGSQRTPKYRCLAAAAERRHPGGYAMMRPVEDAVRAWLATVADDVDTAADAAAAAQARATRRASDAKRLGRELLELEQALTRLTVDHARRLVPEAAYVAARDELEAQARTVAARHRQAEVDARSGDPAAAARALLEDWELLPVAHRRGALRDLIREVRVTPGRPRCRVEVVPSWSRTDRV